MIRNVFTFGCPHSGTTYLWKMIDEIFRPAIAKNEVVVTRIKEANFVHPCRSTEGLIGLSQLLDGSLFIRIVRDPVEIVESFYAKRDARSKNPFRGVNDDDRIIEFIESERINVDRQIRFAKEHDIPFRLIEVSYEQLGTGTGKRDFADALVKEIPVVPNLFSETVGYLKKTWNVVPAREGRLSLGITERLASDEMRSRARELRDLYG